MTEAQIEAIARLYCQKMGLDPDAVVFFIGSAYVPGGVEQWRLKAIDVREVIVMREAIAGVLGEKGEQE